VPRHGHRQQRRLCRQRCDDAADPDHDSDDPDDQRGDFESRQTYQPQTVTSLAAA